MANAKILSDCLINAYKNKGEGKTTEILSLKLDEKPQVRKTKSL